MTRMQQRRSNQDGFTLIEIMVVILILGLLATIVVQSLRGEFPNYRPPLPPRDLVLSPQIPHPPKLEMPAHRQTGEPRNGR